MTPEVQNRIGKELEKRITDWAAEMKVLDADEVIEVSVRIKKLTKVTVKIEGHLCVAEPDNIHLDDLGFTVKTGNWLHSNNLRRVGDIRKMSLEQVLQSHPRLGKKCAREIFDRLLRIGVQLDWQFQ